MTDAEIYTREFGPDVAAHILKITAAARGIKPAQTGLPGARVFRRQTSGPTRSATAHGYNAKLTDAEPSAWLQLLYQHDTIWKNKSVSLKDRVRQCGILNNRMCDLVSSNVGDQRRLPEASNP